MKYMSGKKYIVTGAAGFIGAFLSKRLLENGGRVTGIDNMNGYYDVSLKKSRLEMLSGFENFNFIKADISDKSKVDEIFKSERPDIAVNLAAQAGVRYSIENPDVYISSNIIGFYNILEACRHNPVEQLVYASSSSVYGANKKVPFSVDDKADAPVSLYAATKKSNELMAHCYSKLYGIPVTGLRFFTVYGPMGRPDMAYFSFTKNILEGKAINVFNNGNMERDFTYIDDITAGVERVLKSPPHENENGVKYRLFNIGNSRPEKLMYFIECLESALSRAYGKEIKAKINFMPMQPGDVPATYADTGALEREFGFKPDTPLRDGLMKFARWYKEFYG